jgi:hypothetical protein
VTPAALYGTTSPPVKAAIARPAHRACRKRPPPSPAPHTKPSKGKPINMQQETEHDDTPDSTPPARTSPASREPKVDQTATPRTSFPARHQTTTPKSAIPTNTQARNTTPPAFTPVSAFGAFATSLLWARATGVTRSCQLASPRRARTWHEANHPCPVRRPTSTRRRPCSETIWQSRTSIVNAVRSCTAELRTATWRITIPPRS